MDAISTADGMSHEYNGVIGLMCAPTAVHLVGLPELHMEQFAPNGDPAPESAISTWARENCESHRPRSQRGIEAPSIQARSGAWPRVSSADKIYSGARNR